MKSLTLGCVFVILAVFHLPCAIQASSFTIDYEKDTFLKDGEAFRWALVSEPDPRKVERKVLASFPGRSRLQRSKTGGGNGLAAWERG